MISEDELKALGLTEELVKRIRSDLGREPNFTELGMFGAMYSEHCSYASSRPVLKLFPTKGKQVLVRAGEADAGVVDIGEGLAVVFKIESHNHPSAVEPFQGAATGVGGIIRDIFTMGARPIALLNSLRFGRLEDPSNQRLFRGVVSGISFYGNVMGIPTVGGEVVFDDCYEGNPLVNVMCVGILDTRQIMRARAEGVGNPVFYAGATTGRDGLGGATFASRDLSDQSEADRPAVQAGDPFLEKLLLEGCLELIQAGVVVSMKDMGAAGIVCSTSESAASGELGMEIDLSKIPRRAQGMTAYEIMMSESQERMLIVIKKGSEEKARNIFLKWDIPAQQIGQVTSGNQLTVREGEKVVANIPAKLLTTGAPVYKRKSAEYELPILTDAERRELPTPQNWGEVFDRILDSPSMASKRWVWEQYDHMVQTNTLVLPGRGAAVLRLKGTRRAIAVTTDGNGRYAALDPFLGGQYAVSEAARNLVACGARPLAITDCLNFGNPKRPEVFWQFKRCVEGMSEACRVFGTPVTGGNVSFYNENPRGAIDPTPVVGMVGLIEDVSTLIDSGFQREGDLILHMGPFRDEIGASEYLQLIYGKKLGPVPAIRLETEKALQSLMWELAQERILHSAQDVSDGGLVFAVCEGILKSKHPMGAEILKGDWAHKLSVEAFLFGEGPARMLVTVSPDCEERVTRSAEAHGLEAVCVGVTRGSSLMVKGLFERSIHEMRQTYERAIPKRMGIDE